MTSGSADSGRHERRLGDPDEGFLHEQRDRGGKTEPGFLQAPVGGRLIGSHGRDDAALRLVVARWMCGPGGDVPEAETDERRGVDTGPDHDPEIVRLLFASHAELDGSVEL